MKALFPLQLKTIFVTFIIILAFTFGNISGYLDGLHDNIPKTEKNVPEANSEGLEGHTEIGLASWYDYELDSGWSSIGHFVCATRDFERYSFVKVVNLDNDLEVICRVSDYGPNKDIFPERIIDLSSSAFQSLAPLSKGVIPVKVIQLYDKQGK